MENNIRELTAEGMQHAKDKLKYLTTVRRQEVAEQIATARGFGDLSENAEYDEARNEQGRLEAEIAELEDYIRNAVVIDESKVKFDVVGVGTTVTVFDEEMNEKFTYDIVGPRESDPDSGKISIESPIGIGLSGHRKGEKVTIEAPQGAFVLKIEKVERTRRK